MFTFTAADPIMKEVIHPRVQEFLNTATVVLKYAERDVQVSPTGEFIITYNREMNNNAGSGRPEYPGGTHAASDLPAARPSKYGRSTVPAQLLYTRAQWSGKVVAATKTKDSLINALVEETKRAALKSKVSVNRQLLGDGRDALGFWVSTGPNTAVITDQLHVDTAGAVSNRASDNFESGDTVVDLIDVSNNGAVLGTYILRRGAPTAVGTTVNAGRTFSVFDTAGAAANISGTAATGDYFILTGTGIGPGVNAVRYQMMGLMGIIDNANTPIEGALGLQGVPVATVPDFAAIVEGSYASPVDLSVPSLQAVLGEMDQQSGGEIGGADGVKLILTAQRGLETIVELFRSERIAVNTMELDGGFTGVMFNGQYPIVADKHCRLNTFYLWNPESTKLYTLQDWDWEDQDGSMFYRLNGGDKDALGATLKAYLEFGVTVRNANGVLKGVNMVR